MAGNWNTRLAGTLVVVVGALNLVVGLLSLLTDLVRLSAGVAGGFVAVGALMMAVGALVWRGNRGATIAAFTVFTMLLLFQLSEVATDDPTAGVSVAPPVARFVILGVLVATSGLALWRLRRPATHRDADSFR